MKKIVTLVLACFFLASTGAYAGAHMKAEKDAPKGETKKGESKK